MKIPATSLTTDRLVMALLATLVSVCWGGNFSAGRFALNHFPAVDASILRFVLVCALLAPLALRKPAMYWKDALALSLLYITLHFVMMFQAMAMGLSVGSTIIVAQMGVPFSCILAAIFFRDYLGRWRSVGLLVAFSGLILIAGTPNVTEAFSGFLVAVGAAFAWGLANSYMKVMRPAGVVSTLFWPGLYALPQLMLVSLITGDHDYVQLLVSAPDVAWLGILYNALISSIVGYGIWMWLLQRHAISHVVPFSLTMPLFGMLIAQFFFPEPLMMTHYLGMIFTVIGVGIIVIRRPKLAEIEKI